MSEIKELENEMIARGLEHHVTPKTPPPDEPSTRRERIATAILAVMNTANQTASTPQEMADAALQQADALIAGLDRTAP